MGHFRLCGRCNQLVQFGHGTVSTDANWWSYKRIFVHVWFRKPLKLTLRFMIYRCIIQRKVKSNFKHFTIVAFSHFSKSRVKNEQLATVRLVCFLSQKMLFAVNLVVDIRKFIYLFESHVCDAGMITSGASRSIIDERLENFGLDVWYSSIDGSQVDFFFFFLFYFFFFTKIVLLLVCLLVFSLLLRKIEEKAKFRILNKKATNLIFD